jgi:hypothetical protein
VDYQSHSQDSKGTLRRFRHCLEEALQHEVGQLDSTFGGQADSGMKMHQMQSEESDMSPHLLSFVPLPQACLAPMIVLEYCLSQK